jgi:hypothetical protein
LGDKRSPGAPAQRSKAPRAQPPPTHGPGSTCTTQQTSTSTPHPGHISMPTMNFCAGSVPSREFAAFYIALGLALGRPAPWPTRTVQNPPKLPSAPRRMHISATPALISPARELGAGFGGLRTTLQAAGAPTPRDRRPRERPPPRSARPQKRQTPGNGDPPGAASEALAARRRGRPRTPRRRSPHGRRLDQQRGPNRPAEVA